MKNRQHFSQFFINKVFLVCAFFIHPVIQKFFRHFKLCSFFRLISFFSFWADFLSVSLFISRIFGSFTQLATPNNLYCGRAICSHWKVGNNFQRFLFSIQFPSVSLCLNSIICAKEFHSELHILFFLNSKLIIESGFHDGGSYHMETSPLIYSVNQWWFLYGRSLRHERVNPSKYGKSF